MESLRITDFYLTQICYYDLDRIFLYIECIFGMSGKSEQEDANRNKRRSESINAQNW